MHVLLPPQLLLQQPVGLRTVLLQYCPKTCRSSSLLPIQRIDVI
jgi:hypothetical protein